MKLVIRSGGARITKVTSYAEVWIEIVGCSGSVCSGTVTSYAEVWIEIYAAQTGDYCYIVTSYAEVWIEILLNVPLMSAFASHLLRGSVD